MRLLNAVYCNKRIVQEELGSPWTVKSHYHVPLPLARRFFEETPPAFMNNWREHVTYPLDDDAKGIPAQWHRLQVEPEVKELYDKWIEFEHDLNLIKRNGAELTDSILARYSIDDSFFTRQPKPHQKAGMAFFLRSLELGSGHICLFDEMRTGKTKQAVDIATWLLKNKMVQRVLVIVPNTIKRVWMNEIMLDSPMYGLLSCIIQGTKDQKAALWAQKMFFYIVNYECARADEEEMKVWEEDCRHTGYLLICDEAHKLKNPQSKQSKAILSLNPTYSIFMTGTPVANRPEDAFSMADFICPGVLGQNIEYFQERFGIRGGYQGRQITGYRDLDEVKYRLARLSMRRLRKDIIFDQAVRADRYGTLSGDQKKAYDDMRDFLWAEISKETEWTEIRAQNHMVKILRLQQITSGYLPKVPDSDGMFFLEQFASTSSKLAQTDEDVVWFDNNWKLAELDEFIDEYLDDFGKIVIWSRFVPPILKLVKRYGKYGAVHIRGQMGEKAVDNMYRFQQDPSCRIMIAQIQTSEGKGFQPATLCIFWDKWWSPHLNKQAEDRIVGIKNPVPVTVISLVTEDSIDDRLEVILSKKTGWANGITGDQPADIKLPKFDKAVLLYLLAKPEEAKRLGGELF
jgi:SNF2 family DNA or RNA helicase